MKKIIFALLLITAVGFISGRVSKVAKHEPEMIPELSAGKKASVGSPRILYMLNNDAGHAGWSPSLWWIYQPVQSGC